MRSDDELTAALRGLAEGDGAPEAPAWTDDDRAASRRAQGDVMRRTLFLPAIAAGALCVTAGLPLSRPVVRQQVRMVLGGGVSVLENPALGAGPDVARTLATGRGGDPEVALGAALMLVQYNPNDRSGKTLELLRPAIDRAPSDPALRAAALEFGLERLDGGQRNPPPPTAAELTQLLGDADAGEKAAPDNALFPLLRAAALLRAGQDDAAIQAALAAAKKPAYDDYGARQSAALWRFQDASSPEPATGLTRIGASTVFNTGYLKSVRAVARRLQELAYTRETAGDAAGGLEVSAALLTLGERLQSDGSSLIENLVGTSVGRLAVVAPGKAAKDDTRNTAFSRFAREHGRADLVRRADSLAAHESALKAMVERSNAVLMGDIFATSYRWFGALALLLSAVWTVLCGGIAYGLSRTGRIRRGERLDPAVGWGLALGGAIPPALGLAATGAEPWGMVGMALCLALVAAAAFQLRARPGQALVKVGATVLSSVGLFAVAGWITLGPGISLARPGGAATLAQQGVLCGALCLAVPLLTAIGLAIASKRHRIPASVGIVRGFRKLAVPAASVLLVLYAVAAIFAAVADQSLVKSLRAIGVHEGRFYAGRLGQPWPPAP